MGVHTGLEAYSMDGWIDCGPGACCHDAAQGLDLGMVGGAVKMKYSTWNLFSSGLVIAVW